MKLDRNQGSDGLGKYALLNLRKNIIEWGRTEEEDEFFVIKLKDRHAKPALLAYAKSIAPSNPEFASEIINLANRAGTDSKWCKEPD